MGRRGGVGRGGFRRVLVVDMLKAARIREEREENETNY